MLTKAIARELRIPHSGPEGIKKRASIRENAGW
jgi:hypothetical protein